MSFLNSTTVNNPSGGFLSGTKIVENPTPSYATPDPVEVEQDKKKRYGSVDWIKDQKERSQTVLPELGKSILRNTWAIYEATPQKIVDDIKAGASDIQKGGVGEIMGIPIMNKDKGKIKVAFRTAGDIANAIFAPLSAAIGSVLEVSGGQQLQDKAGQKIADSSGITDMPAFQQFAMEHPNFGEDFTRLLTLIMSKADRNAEINPKELLIEVKKTADNLVSNANKSEAVMKQLTVKSDGAETKVPISTPNTRQAEYAKSQGYEPYTNVDQLPVIDMGKPAKDSLPTIQVGESVRVTKNSKGDFVYETIKETPQVKPEATKDISFLKSTKLADSAPKQESYQQSFNQEQRPISKTVQDLATEIGMDSRNLPGYETMNLEQRAQQSLDLITNDPEKAMRVALGSEEAPTGLHPENVFTAVRKLAREKGDFETLRQLTNSKLPSVAAQRLKALDDNLGEVDPLRDMNKIKTGREEAVAKKFKKPIEQLKTETATEIRNEIRKNNPTKKTWDDFIQSIKCGY